MLAIGQRLLAWGVGCSFVIQTDYRVRFGPGTIGLVWPLVSFVEELRHADYSGSDLRERRTQAR